MSFSAMDYASAIEWLYGTQLFGIKLGLENVRRLCGEAQVPGRHRLLVHVAGTNGKGSVCAMTEAVCRAGGWRTGLFISPHLVTYRERISVNGEWIGEGEAAAGLTRLRDAVSGWDPHPTFFELSTVLALMHFAERGVEVLILETGMGGRLDATTAAAEIQAGRGDGLVSVITPIGLDHQQWLGQSLAEIAAEKAGIIQPGAAVVSAAQEPEVEEVLRTAARRRNAPIRFVAGSWEEGPVGLEGAHQRRNAGLALAALEEASLPLPPEALRSGIAGVRWRGRFQRVAGAGGLEIVLDGAHNPAATRVLLSAWREAFGSSKATVIFGALASKDYVEMLRLLEPIAEHLIFCAVHSVRAVAPEKLAAACGRPGAVAASADEAFAMARRDGARRILVTGSLYLVGEALAQLEGGGFEPSAQ